MVKTGAFPGATGLMAFRALSFEVIGWFIQIMAAHAIGSSRYGVVEGSWFECVCIMAS